MRSWMLCLSLVAWAAMSLGGAVARERRPDIQVRTEAHHVVFAYRGVDYPYIGCDHRSLANCFIETAAIQNGLKSYAGERVAIHCLIPLRDHTTGSTLTYADPFAAHDLKLGPDQVGFTCQAPGLKNSSPVAFFAMDRALFQRARADDQKLMLPATQVSGVILLGRIEDRSVLYTKSELMVVDAYIPTGVGLDGASYAKGALAGLGYGAKLAGALSSLGLL